MDVETKDKNELQLFTDEKFGTIRTIMIDGDPWFVAADVCKILGVSNPTDALNKGLEDFEKARLNLGLQGGATNIISESGFYTLVLRSRKPIAKPFRIWVTSEVLPSIRKTGKYIAPTSDKMGIMIEEMGCNLKIAYAQINNIEEMLEEQAEKLNQVLDNSTINMTQQKHISNLAKSRICSLLGGKGSKEYKQFNKLYFQNLWGDIKRKFSCSGSYHDLNPKDYDKALAFISKWVYNG